ncbi:MAG: sensor histidine kinase [Anaerolineales bacterium]|nr:sensor histidine kinase [Anaerolineales bacterium]
MTQIPNSDAVVSKNDYSHPLPAPYAPKRKWRPFRLDRAGDLATVMITIAAFLIIFGTGNPPYPRNLLLIPIGIVYLIIATAGWSRLLLKPTPWRKLAYFAVQFLLSAAIHILALGNGYLVILPVTAHAVSLLPGWLGLLACVLAWLIMMFPFSVGFDLPLLISAGLSSAGAIFFVAIFTRVALNEELARDRAERLTGELQEANRKLRQYAAQVEELAIARERNRLAREIHDGLGHYLTAINMQIKAAQALLSAAPQPAAADLQTSRELLEKSQGLTQEALADVRRSVSTLREIPAMTHPLSETAERLLEEVRRAGLVAELQVLGEPPPLPESIRFALYRVLQEGLTNVRKHALASRVDLALDYTQPNRVGVRIQDNGIGLAAQAPGAAAPDGNPGFGLLGLRERLALLNGTVETHPAPGEGFMLEAWLPIPAEETDDPPAAGEAVG